MLVSHSGACEARRGHAHGNTVRYRAIVRDRESCIVGYGGACKTTYAAHESGEKLAAKEGAK